MKNAKDAPKAYKIYVVQMRQKLGAALRVFQSPDELGPASVKSALMDFHMLRGGAGFFGLDDIAAAAEKIEEILELASVEKGENSDSQLTKRSILPILEDMTSIAEEIQASYVELGVVEEVPQ